MQRTQNTARQPADGFFLFVMIAPEAGSATFRRTTPARLLRTKAALGRQK